MQAALRDLEIEFAVNVVQQVASFRESFTAALKSESTFLPSSLHVFPDGTEQGEYLAIDLGGSNLRCAVVALTGHAPPLIRSIRVWIIPSHHKVGPAPTLFDWIAQCIAQVASQYDQGKLWRLGVTFSFPVQETSISSGLIMDMGKAYNLVFAGPEDRCIKALLSAALVKSKVFAEIVLCVNDSNATLLSQAYMDRSARMSLVLGTGCNAAMYMQTGLLESSGKKWQCLGQKSKEAFVNCELSLLGKDVLPYTKYDSIINAYDINRSFQPLEYATTGPWLGELARVIILDLIQKYGFLDGIVPESFKMMFSLQTDTLWRMEEASVSEHAAQAIFNDRHPQHGKSWAIDEVDIVRQVSLIVTNRSAVLIATSLYSLKSLLKMQAGDQSLHVACCGSIIENYPNYCKRVQTCLDSLQAKIRLFKSSNSGVLGAAIGAACISHQS
ncbi:putative Hexokinase [Taphrina deformans PYCC 5710]|uniref:Phosphotransferase n=1 Tax=Taphrina deformans (strain PYCC 5710 / ATCC 11124 / CBS 356.35 / IMI 108563 / JCM 9778 / NBRC 8474) TaxID=1097556 RepID=R4XB47_TAPDE|nr:putative Hexokinase [Taphrina deformans PYCC 5710]|eukprot:CCG83099.1 putative Hexokinase [Taphrina deformans PYCC 5710]